MAIDDKIRNKNIHYDINRPTWKMYALSSVKIDKYGYMIGEKLLALQQNKKNSKS